MFSYLINKYYILTTDIIVLEKKKLENVRLNNIYINFINNIDTIHT